jgi:predicted RNA-binding Zn ribbon-like protein
MTELNVVGGDVALDLVNTVEPRVPGGSDGNDHLRSSEDLLAWSLRVGLLTSSEAEQVRTAWHNADQAASGLSAALELREATYAVMLAELGVAADGAEPALAVLQRLWAQAVARAALSLTPSGSSGDRLQIGTDPSTLIIDRLAHAAVGLLRTLDVRQLKACPLDEGGCGWLFLDKSRNNSRRWCSMEDCGGRAKARRLTARRRSARPR